MTNHYVIVSSFAATQLSEDQRLHRRMGLSQEPHQLTEMTGRLCWVSNSWGMALSPFHLS